MVDAANHVDGRKAILDEIIGVGFDDESNTLPLEIGQQVLHRTPEQRLACRGILRPPIELRQHFRNAELGCDLNGSTPVAHRRQSRVLPGTRPAEQREDCCDLHIGSLQCGLERLDI